MTSKLLIQPDKPITPSNIETVLNKRWVETKGEPPTLILRDKRISINRKYDWQIILLGQYACYLYYKGKVVRQLEESIIQNLIKTKKVERFDFYSNKKLYIREY